MQEYLKHKVRNNFILKNRIRHVAGLHQLDRIALKSYENEQFLELFRYAYQKSAFYRSYYQEHGIQLNDIKSLDDMKRLPFITKDMVRKASRQLFTCHPKLTMKGFTSGTSGSPLVVYRSLKAIIEENAYVVYFREMHGIREGDRIVSMRGNLDKDTLSYFNKAENILYLSSYNINEQTITQYRKLITEFAPKAILAYPSSLEMLANAFSNQGWSMEIPVAITSSETLYQFQREKIRNILGAETFDWYGNAERTIAAEELPGHEYFLVPGYGIAEKENGQLLTTSLINRAFPLIRYEVGDSLEWTENDADKGKGHPASARVLRLEGRQDDFVVLPDGSRVGRLDIAFKGVNHLLYAQIIQNDTASLLVHLVPGTLFGSADRQLLLANLSSLLGTTLKIVIRDVAVADIKKTASGKFKLVISNL